MFCLRGKWGESQKKQEDGGEGGEWRKHLLTNPWIWNPFSSFPSQFFYSLHFLRCNSLLPNPTETLAMQATWTVNFLNNSPWNEKEEFNLSWTVILVVSSIIFDRNNIAWPWQDNHPSWCSCSDFCLLRAEQEADGWKRHLTRLCVVITSICHKLRKFVSKNDIFFFVKRKMPILFPVNCKRTNLFSLKRDLNWTPFYHPHLKNIFQYFSSSSKNILSRRNVVH